MQRLSIRRVSPKTLRLLGSALSLAALAILLVILRNADWQELAAPLTTARPEWLAAALVAALAVEVLKTVRWQVLLAIDLARLWEMLALVFSARLLNALAPLRAGDMWRVAFVAKSDGRGIVAAGGSIIVEKVMDATTLGAIGLMVLGSAAVDRIWLTLISLALLSLGVISAVYRRHPRLRTVLSPWLQGLRNLRRPRALIAAGALTGVAMGTGLLVNLLVLQALGMPITVMTGAIMLLAGYAAGVLPAGPAQLGVFELAVAAPLIGTGMPPASAIAVAITLHLVVLATLAAGALLALPLGALEQVRGRTRADQTVPWR